MRGGVVVGRLRKFCPFDCFVSEPDGPDRGSVFCGSMSDIFAREIADKLNRKWNQTVIVENRPGAAGTYAASKAPADGYTLVLVSNGHVILNAINATLPFDAIKDFQGVSTIAKAPVLLVVPNDLPVNSLKEFVALVRSRPGEMSYSSAGLGSTSNIAGEHFIRTEGIKMVHVPYKGAPEAYTGVMRGDTQAFFTPPGVGEDLVVAGKVKALGVSSSARLPKFPDVPTFAEAGIPEAAYEISGSVAGAGRRAAGDRRQAQPRHRRRHVDTGNQKSLRAARRDGVSAGSALNSQ